MKHFDFHWTGPHANLTIDEYEFPSMDFACAAAKKMLCLSANTKFTAVTVMGPSSASKVYRLAVTRHAEQVPPSLEPAP